MKFDSFFTFNRSDLIIKYNVSNSDKRLSNQSKTEISDVSVNKLLSKGQQAERRSQEKNFNKDKRVSVQLSFSIWQHIRAMNCSLFSQSIHLNEWTTQNTENHKHLVVKCIYMYVFQCTIQNSDAIGSKNVLYGCLSLIKKNKETNLKKNQYLYKCFFFKTDVECFDHH